MSFKISHLAALDLEQIWVFTFNTWSQRQADKYYALFIQSIDTICAQPEIGTPIDFVKKGHRMMPIKSHLIVYKIKHEIIYINRILHKNMDIESRLRE